MSTGQHDAQQALEAGIVRGLLPAGATLPEQDSRPWPVTLLTAVGAWLAAVPLLGVVSMLLGGWMGQDQGMYTVGMLLLGAALTVLRSRALPVFLEQLAVPALLVGAGSLGFGLFRDLPMQAAAAILCAVALGFAWAIPRPWLRSLLGAAAAGLCVVMLLPDKLYSSGGSPLLRGWLALNAAMLVWLAALALQRRSEPHLAGLIESVAAGWLMWLLAGLCWWSGMTFLLGGTLGGGFRELGGALPPPHGGGNSFMLLQAGSLALGTSAAALGARRWAGLRQPLAAGVAMVLAALCWFMPAMGAVLLALACTVTSGRSRQAAAAGVAAAWIVGSFYYQLQWPLAQKAVVLVATGALLGALTWAARRPVAAIAGAPTPPLFHRAAALIALSAVAPLALVNVSIWQSETLIAQGDKVFVALAPVDPRSLMQGDFMRLNYSLPGATDRSRSDAVTLQRPHVIARRDARGVAQLLRIETGHVPLAAGEMRIELTPKDGRWMLVSDAWFFREGDGKRWETAKYGEFRVHPDGRALLVGLADDQLRTIPIAP